MHVRGCAGISVWGVLRCEARQSAPPQARNSETTTRAARLLDRRLSRRTVDGLGSGAGGRWRPLVLDPRTAAAGPLAGAARDHVTEEVDHAR